MMNGSVMLGNNFRLLDGGGHLFFMMKFQLLFLSSLVSITFATSTGSVPNIAYIPENFPSTSRPAALDKPKTRGTAHDCPSPQPPSDLPPLLGSRIAIAINGDSDKTVLQLAYPDLADRYFSEVQTKPVGDHLCLLRLPGRPYYFLRMITGDTRKSPVLVSNPDRVVGGADKPEGVLRFFEEVPSHMIAEKTFKDQPGHLVRYVGDADSEVKE